MRKPADGFAEIREMDDIARIFGVDEKLDDLAGSLCGEIDPEIFFPEKGGSTRAGKRICAACPVRVKCLEIAMENDFRYGIWGGLSERERRQLKKVRRAAGLAVIAEAETLTSVAADVDEAVDADAVEAVVDAASSVSTDPAIEDAPLV